MKRLLILGCSQSKTHDDGEIPAVDRYRPGAYYQMLHQVDREFWPEIIILSAEYGWITGRAEIEDYDRQLDKDRAAELAADQEQHDFVYATVGCKHFDEIFVAMGRQYWDLAQEFLEDLPQGRYQFANGGIGEQRHQLKAWLSMGVIEQLANNQPANERSK